MLRIYIDNGREYEERMFDWELEIDRPIEEKELAKSEVEAATIGRLDEWRQKNPKPYRADYDSEGDYDGAWENWHRLYTQAWVKILEECPEKIPHLVSIDSWGWHVLVVGPGDIDLEDEIRFKPIPRRAP